MSVSHKKNYQICILSDMLAIGGAEKASALLSIYFEKNNCNVTHIIVQDIIEYEYAGTILNLGKLKKCKGFNLVDRIHRFTVLVRFFNQNKFDYIIDTRVKTNSIQEFFIAKVVFNAPSIVVIHHFMTQLYFPKNKILASKIYKNFFKIITVSNAIKDKVKLLHNYNSIETIHNPLDFNQIAMDSTVSFSYSFNYILGVGRMQDNIKQFDLLIRSYAISDLPKNGVKLLLLGDGDYKKELVKLSQELKLDDKVYFEGRVANPFMYYKNALFTVLSSKSEGFPMVILESLACETPVVSFDCYSGPREIIVDKQNGLLVENQNFEAFTIAINTMFSNKELYLQCKFNAKNTVIKYSLDTIGKQWLQMMQIDTNGI